MGPSPAPPRDLKPENVFLVDDGGCEQAKILDFGIAKLLSTDSQSTSTGTGALGTLHYIRLDQLRGMAADPTWDVWALAVIAYEILTEVLPFDRASAADCQAAVHAERPTPIRAHVPEATAAIECLFERSLGASPASRPARAPQLLAELETALAARASAGTS
jgi:serine/threonine-protein kinase